MSLFSMFHPEVSIQNLITIHVGNKRDDQLTAKFGQLIGDLVVIGALWRNLKEAHKAFQEFADHFQRAYQVQINPCLETAFRQLETPIGTHGTAGATKALAAIWMEHRASGDFVTRHEGIMRCDPNDNDGTRYRVLTRLLTADVHVPEYEDELNVIRTVGKRFKNTATQVVPAVAAFEKSVLGTDLMEMKDAANAVLRAAAAAASNCDALLQAAETMHRFTASSLRKLVPGDPYRIPGLEPVSP